MNYGLLRGIVLPVLNWLESSCHSAEFIPRIPRIFEPVLQDSIQFNWIGTLRNDRDWVQSFGCRMRFRRGGGLGEPEALLDGCRDQPDRSVQFGRIAAQLTDLERTGPPQGHRGGSHRRVYVLDRLGSDAQDRARRNGRDAAFHSGHQQFDVAQRTCYRPRSRAALLGRWRHQSHRICLAGRSRSHRAHRRGTAASLR